MPTLNTHKCYRQTLRDRPSDVITLSYTLYRENFVGFVGSDLIFLVSNNHGKDPLFVLVAIVSIASSLTLAVVSRNIAMSPISLIQTKRGICSCQKKKGTSSNGISIDSQTYLEKFPNIFTFDDPLSFCNSYNHPGIPNYTGSGGKEPWHVVVFSNIPGFSLRLLRLFI